MAIYLSDIFRQKFLSEHFVVSLLSLKPIVNEYHLIRITIQSYSPSSTRLRTKKYYFSMENVNPEAWRPLVDREHIK